MKRHRLPLLAAIGVGAIAVAFADGAVSLPLGHVGASAGNQADRHLIDADYEDESHDRRRFNSADDDHHDLGEREHDDDRGYADHEDYDDHHDDDDRGFGPIGAGNAAPPDNGLILKGSKPKVQVN